MARVNVPLVEIMGEGGPVPAYSIASSYNQETGEYFAPMPPDEFKAVLKLLYLKNPGATEQKFEKVWPRYWELTETVYSDADGVHVIIDSGVLPEHPLLKGCIREIVDFTGEGGEDLCGHGTMVALLTRMMFTGIPREKFIILKCVGVDGKGTQENLIKGLNWLRDFTTRGNVKVASAVMSLGTYNKRLFGLFDCDGTCPLCAAAVEASKDVPLSVAAGNTPHKTACPAKAAFLPSKPNIAAVSRPEEATSGKGTASMNLSFGRPIKKATFRPD